MNAILESIQALGPMLAGAWLLTIALVVLRPQQYINSFLLMFSLLVTLIFVTSCFGEEGPTFALVSFLLVMLALLLVPLLLIINGIQMIRRESLCLAHCLSLALGLFVGVGELAAIVYVLSLSGTIGAERVSLWVMLLVWTVFYFSSLVLSFVIYSIFIQVLPHRMNFNYVIIHGCGLAGGERLTRLLSNRVDKAMEIYEKCAVKPIIIPSGGQGGDEKLSEAEAMRRYLVEHGIPDEHIILEDRSATTAENIAFSKAIIDGRRGQRKTALVSSNYHVYRCLRLAKEVGLRCTGIGADVAFYYWPSALIREFVAVFLSKRFLIWSLAGYLLFVSPTLYALLR
jgi:uncharacterized SAM-binding protein YcdF (DUF218 family)